MKYCCKICAKFIKNQKKLDKNGKKHYNYTRQTLYFAGIEGTLDELSIVLNKNKKVEG
jgi:hypothetical protein